MHWIVFISSSLLLFGGVHLLRNYLVEKKWSSPSYAFFASMDMVGMFAISMFTLGPFKLSTLLGMFTN